MYEAKILVVGCPAAGKTSLIHKAVNNQMTSEYKPTIGVDFAQKQFVINDEKVMLQLWDIAGQDFYSKLVHVYYKNAIGCILTCDFSNDHIIQDIKMWYDEIRSKALLKNGVPVPIYLACNKIDIPKAKQMMEDEGIKMELQNFQFAHQGFTSALTGEGVTEMLTFVAEETIKVAKNAGSEKDKLNAVIIQDDKAKKSGCC
ncbi:Rab1a [Hexamita inflata]|uniref:Rab1a n=1 Tax=Hexamita inflata TaxID=28002 RepID=A0AA86RNP7_9EUKA|nr:Rab1a [Hexamita inflata]CAI9967722.1 Rab1a [Hexamita inflata]CAI9976848.1 Rab1a [Hexamita inflata]